MKRLVGLPGEEIELVGGDVFANGRRVRKEPGEATDMWIRLCDTHDAGPIASPDTPHWEPLDASSTWREDRGRWSCDGTRGGGRRTGTQGRYNGAPSYKCGSKTIAKIVIQPLPTGDIKIDGDLQELRGDGTITCRWSFRGHSMEATITSMGKVQITTGNEAAGGTLPSSFAKGGKLTFAQATARRMCCSMMIWSPS